jgi:AAA15 family ATPase/GTPase
MIIRFVVQNIYSFGDATEFNMLPRPKIRTPEGHKYSVNGFDLLKLSAMYGPNAAGKSNFIKAVGLIQKLVLGEISSTVVQEAQFKFGPSENVRQVLAIEFLQDNQPFYYAVELVDGHIQTEELYLSGLGKTPDILLFERKTLSDNQEVLTFSKEFEQDEKSQLLKTILSEEFLDPTYTMFEWVAHRDNPHLKAVKTAYNWFLHALRVIGPASNQHALAQKLDNDPHFKKFVGVMLPCFNLGISNLEFVSKTENDVSDISETPFSAETGASTSNSKRTTHHYNIKENQPLAFVKEPALPLGKKLQVSLINQNGKQVNFNLNSISDGTIRLLDYLSAFYDLINQPKVYLIDEFDRSIHPSLAKELIKKFATDMQTKGQLILTTHASDLLDHSIFRQDEVWLAEKKVNGATELYALSDFKEHNTIDIRKGYLNGRYGAVPFLSDLQDLNWHLYDLD